VGNSDIDAYALAFAALFASGVAGRSLACCALTFMVVVLSRISCAAVLLTCTLNDLLNMIVLLRGAVNASLVAMIKVNWQIDMETPIYPKNPEIKRKSLRALGS